MELGEDQLVVFDRGRPKHRVQLETVTSVRERFNRTVLALRDGAEIPISHWNFVTSDDARDFRRRLAARLETAGG